MSFIEIDKVSYAYPVYEEIDESEAPSKEGVLEETSKTDVKDEKDWALKDISLSIEQGDFVAIVGRNGSGKSTLSKLLNALLLPDKGTVFVSGIETKDDETIWEVRRNVGMVFQNPDNQIVSQTVEEDVAFGLENLGVPPEEIRQKVKESLKLLEIENFEKRSPLDLSGGQKQRVAVSGVLAMEPKCIVFDEATSMLDPKGRNEVLKFALKLNKEKNITIVSITHYMDEALMADKIFVMGKGQIVLEGTPKEIFSKKEEIEKEGLMLPQITELSYRLRKAGLDIPEGILFEDELLDYLKEIL